MVKTATSQNSDTETATEMAIQCTPLICTAFGRDSEVHISEACL